MNPKKIYIFLIFFNVISVVVAWFLLNNQSEKHQMAIASIEAKIEKSSVVAELKSSVKPQAKIKSIAAPKIVQIPIYTKADGSGLIFTTFKDRDELIITRSDDEWAEVISTRGFPVWVRGDLVESFSKGYVNVIVNTANARSSPGTSNSISLGKLHQGEVLKINKKQGQWIRVWSPIKFKAWVKKRDFG